MARKSADVGKKARSAAGSAISGDGGARSRAGSARMKVRSGRRRARAAVRGGSEAHEHAPQSRAHATRVTPAGPVPPDAAVQRRRGALRVCAPVCESSLRTGTRLRTGTHGGHPRTQKVWGQPVPPAIDLSHPRHRHPCGAASPLRPACPGWLWPSERERNAQRARPHDPRCALMTAHSDERKKERSPPSGPPSANAAAAAHASTACLQAERGSAQHASMRAPASKISTSSPHPTAFCCPGTAAAASGMLVRRLALGSLGVGAGVGLVAAAADPQGAVRRRSATPRLTQLHTDGCPSRQRAAAACVPRTARALATFASVAADVKWSLWRAPAGTPAYAAAREQVRAAWAMRYAIALRSRRAQLHERTAAALLRLCRANGGIYTKAGQLLSTAQGVPPAYRAALASLQDAAPPRAFAEVDAALRAELGSPAAALFAAFEPTAAAAASLAQARRLRAVWAAWRACVSSCFIRRAATLPAAGAPRAHARRTRRRRQGAPAHPYERATSVADASRRMLLCASQVQYAGLATAVAADLLTLRALAAAALALASPGAVPDLAWLVAQLKRNLARGCVRSADVATRLRMTERAHACMRARRRASWTSLRRGATRSARRRRLPPRSLASPPRPLCCGSAPQRACSPCSGWMAAGCAACIHARGAKHISGMFTRCACHCLLRCAGG
jgi:hypothetical protein